MPKFSKEKLKELKSSKNYTIQDISCRTGIPKSTVEKIFGGFNKNPTIDSLQKLAQLFECGIDDFFDYDKEPSSVFTRDRIISKLITYLYEKEELKNLIDKAKDLSVEDINILSSLAERLQK